MTTHTYPSPVSPAPGTLPACGCEAPDWLLADNALAGCGNCGRAMDPRLCCPGPPASPHWPAWLAERGRLEVLRVAAEVALAEAERLHRIDQRRKDAGRSRSVEHAVAKESARAKAEGRVPQIVSVPGHKQRAGTAAVDEASAALSAIQKSIFELQAECQMCALAWAHAHQRWIAAGLVDDVRVAAAERAEIAGMEHERSPSAETRKIQIETEAAAALALVQAIERARLADKAVRQ